MVRKPDGWDIFGVVEHGHQGCPTRWSVAVSELIARKPHLRELVEAAWHASDCVIEAPDNYSTVTEWITRLEDSAARFCTPTDPEVEEIRAVLVELRRATGEQLGGGRYLATFVARAVRAAGLIYERYDEPNAD